MSLRNKLMGAAITTALVSVLGVNAVAQEPQGPSPDRNRPDRVGRRDGIEGRERLRGREMGKRRLLRQLDLTDAQREQVRAAAERNREATKTQREELRQLAGKRREGTLTTAEEARVRALRDEIRSSMQSNHGNLLGILTPEQKARLEQIKNERKERHKEMRGRQRKGRSQQAPPANIQ
ncbi:MAG: Spy/CpxP family protein refolding chaperone [Pyrinomonadaceae bacterium]